MQFYGDDSNILNPGAGLEHLFLRTLYVYFQEVDRIDTGFAHERAHRNCADSLSAIFDYLKSSFGMGVGPPEGNFAVFFPQGGLNGSYGAVLESISYQCREVLRLGLDCDDFRRRILASEQNTSHADVSSNIHDCFRVEIHATPVISLFLADQNILISAEIRGIQSKVNRIVGTGRRNCELSGRTKEARGCNGTNPASSAELVVPLQSSANPHGKTFVKEIVILTTIVS